MSIRVICCGQGGEDKPVTDQWLPPFVIVDDDDKPVGTIEDGDAVRSCLMSVALGETEGWRRSQAE